MLTENTKEIYSSMNEVWPIKSNWYDYTHSQIIKYVHKELKGILNAHSLILNAGSGGSIYDINGIIYHLDISEKLINKYSHHIVASIEKIPCDDCFFDVIICVGSVINYCSALESLSEFSRILKPNGILILEFERSNSAELWFTKDYGKNITLQRYNYMNNIHNLWLYSEKYILTLAQSYNLFLKNRKRYHSASAIINCLTKDEEFAGKWHILDGMVKPISYFIAHNILLTFKKD